jgi:hypothetical protein
MFLLSLIFSAYATTPLKVAVIDSGLENNTRINLCTKQKNILDINGHGTNVSHAIDSQITNKNGYCQVIYKVINEHGVIMDEYIKALKNIANRKDINIVNISLSGTTHNASESKYIKQIVKSGKIVIIASGNKGINLSEKCTAYPACINEPDLVIVGNKDHEGKITPNSNFGGPVDIYEEGNFCHKGKCLFGTSQSAAIITGKILNRAIKTMERE